MTHTTEKRKRLAALVRKDRERLARAPQRDPLPREAWSLPGWVGPFVPGRDPEAPAPEGWR